MNFWLKLSDDLFLFGAGGITSVKQIDLRDKPSSYAYKTELFAGPTRIALVMETVEEINACIKEKTVR
jgi:hypothetical protein